ncbi:MAG: hypothetical protein SOT69_10795 [Mesosutterella sp.]|nr:hypothetical protein [Mesosutterella sp.]
MSYKLYVKKSDGTFAEIAAGDDVAATTKVKILPVENEKIAITAVPPPLGPMSSYGEGANFSPLAILLGDVKIKVIAKVNYQAGDVLINGSDAGAAEVTKPYGEIFADGVTIGATAATAIPNGVFGGVVLTMTASNKYRQSAVEISGTDLLISKTSDSKYQCGLGAVYGTTKYTLTLVAADGMEEWPDSLAITIAKGDTTISTTCASGDTEEALAQVPDEHKEEARQAMLVCNPYSVSLTDDQKTTLETILTAKGETFTVTITSSL